MEAVKEEFPGSELERELRESCSRGAKNLSWMRRNLHPYFFISMQEEHRALANLAAGLHTLQHNRRLILSDNPRELILAVPETSAALYDTLRECQCRGISYAEITRSARPLPRMKERVEIQRFEFDLKSRPPEDAPLPDLPKEKVRLIKRCLHTLYPNYDRSEFSESLEILLRNNESYVRLSAPERIARALRLLQECRRQGGLFLDLEDSGGHGQRRESRIVFSVGNPPEQDFLSQTMEVFRRLGLNVHRAYCLVVYADISPRFLGTFYVSDRRGRSIRKNSPVFKQLKAELYNTQILSTSSRPYAEFVTGGVMTGEEASFTNALVAFCYTTLAHNQPDRFHLSEIVQAFAANPAVTLQLYALFRTRFDPEARHRKKHFREKFAGVERALARYNTGHRHLDEVRREIFRTAAVFIRHTLKTNFFVPEKHALAFRMDPRYLSELGEKITGDLPAGEAFRVTFFSGRHGVGYHISFSDIARGGWRTIICTDEDDYNENVETIFREAYTLAHTQHLKNKDIYEGGSKMVVILDASDASGAAVRTQRLYKLQLGFINAFFDLFASVEGRPCHPRVVDYYGDEEAIELGPDENMHDDMIETIARQSVRRGYLLGTGIISSKKAGINHKQYGVTSLGVVTFAALTMAELGIDISRQSFSVKMTGGPSGDVAGNTLRLLLERCPRVKVKLVVDASGYLYDPEGIDRRELRKLIMRSEIGEFNAGKMHPGGVLLNRRISRRERLRELFCKTVRTAEGVREEWITTDDMYEDFEGAVFSVSTDLFIPAGGRPETVNEENWERLFDRKGLPTCRAIVEGANSFIVPEARVALQKKGIVVIRDASANKCGVISSSYEIISSLMMSEEEFLRYKENYVSDVMKILEKRAGDEARLIFRRRRESGDTLLYTEISDAISTELNDHYTRLFDYFQARPELLRRPHFREVLRCHLPRLMRTSATLRRRLSRIPLKYRCAMVASEIATRIVYGDQPVEDFDKSIVEFVKRNFPLRRKERGR